MKPKVTLTNRYTVEELREEALKLRDSGKCSVKDPKFYEPWNMVKFGTEEYNKAFNRKKPY